MIQDTDHMIYVTIQGKLKDNPDAQSLYVNYLQGTVPLMSKYQVSIFAVGAGIKTLNFDHSSQQNHHYYPINAILRFPKLELMEAFFADPEYLHIKTLYRDPAYEYLSLSAFSHDYAQSDDFPPHEKITLVLHALSCHHSKATMPYLFAQGIDHRFMDAYWHHLSLYTVDQKCTDPLLYTNECSITQWENRPAVNT